LVLEKIKQDIRVFIEKEYNKTFKSGVREEGGTISKPRSGIYVRPAKKDIKIWSFRRSGISKSGNSEEVDNVSNDRD
jgi:hypothetical protein